MQSREALIKSGALKGMAFRPSVNAGYNDWALAPEALPTGLIRPYLAWIIHELKMSSLSGEPAKNFRPASFAGRAGAQSKDLQLFLTAQR